MIVRGPTGRWSTYWSLVKCLSRMTHRVLSILESVKLCESAFFIADTGVKFRNRWAVPKWQPLTWPGLVQDHLRKTSIVNRQWQFPPVSSRIRANCLMENTTTSSSIRRELQWRKVDLDKKLYGYVFLCLIRFLNIWPEFIVGLETNPRPILQDQDQDRKSGDQDQDHRSQDQDRDQDHKNSVSSALEIETEVSRTTSLTSMRTQRRALRRCSTSSDRTLYLQTLRCLI